MASVPLPLLQSGAVKFTAPWFDRYRLRPCPNKKTRGLRRALETVILFLPAVCRRRGSGPRRPGTRFRRQDSGTWPGSPGRLFRRRGGGLRGRLLTSRGSGRSPLLCHLGQLLVDFPGGLHLHHQQQDQLIPHPQQDGPHRQDHQAQGQVLKP